MTAMLLGTVLFACGIQETPTLIVHDTEPETDCPPFGCDRDTGHMEFLPKGAGMTLVFGWDADLGQTVMLNPATTADPSVFTIVLGTRRWGGWADEDESCVVEYGFDDRLLAVWVEAPLIWAAEGVDPATGLSDCDAYMDPGAFVVGAAQDLGSAYYGFGMGGPADPDLVAQHGPFQVPVWGAEVRQDLAPDPQAMPAGKAWSTHPAIAYGFRVDDQFNVSPVPLTPQEAIGTGSLASGAYVIWLPETLSID